MASFEKIALLGFLPWTDAARGVAVRENPALLASLRAARALRRQGFEVACLAVPVSDEGVVDAVRAAERLEAGVVIGCGQTLTAPRVERFGRAPSRLAPPTPGEEPPWLLAPDATALARMLQRHALPEARLEPMRVSDDAGGYYCDHLCVELARLSRRRPVRARFLHLTAIDGCAPALRSARLEQYAHQLVVLVRHLARRRKA